MDFTNSFAILNLSRGEVAKHCPGAKSACQDIFKCPSKFFENYICWSLLRILQQLIEEYTIVRSRTQLNGQRQDMEWHGDKNITVVCS